MRQTGRRSVAPNNPAPKWPQGYVAVLRETGAQEKQIPYCLNWVRRFFAANPGRRRRDLGRAEIEAYLQYVAGYPGISNWQVQQARDALELYYEQFRGIALDPRPDGISAPAASTPPPSVTPPSRLSTADNGGNRSPSQAEDSSAAGSPFLPPEAANLNPVTERYRPGVREGKHEFHKVTDDRTMITDAGPASGGPASTGPATAKERVNWKALDARVREYLRLAVCVSGG